MKFEIFEYFYKERKIVNYCISKIKKEIQYCNYKEKKQCPFI